MQLERRLTTINCGIALCAAMLTVDSLEVRAQIGGSSRLTAEQIPWVGHGRYRIIVEIAPVKLKDRMEDELPADLEIDLSTLLNPSENTRRADIASLQVTQFDGKTGEPVSYENYAHARGPFDRPFCWYDGAIPYDFPEVFAPSSYSGGKLKRVNSLRAGYMYNAVGNWQRGHLAFTHTQTEEHPSFYAIYFDVLPSSQAPQRVPPRGWLGDGLPRRDLTGESTTGSDGTKISLDDWNGDGLIDIVYGEQYGQLFVMPNTGTAEEPAFSHTKMLFDVEGKPIDVGIHAAVLVVDWDNDGVKDLLAGTYQNSIAFLRNTGTNRDRRFVYQGFISTADGRPLMLPVTPVAEKPEGVFTHDYFPVLSAVDWNDDGRLDLIAGGYVTGRIYYYENVAQQPGTLPQLVLSGPVEADNQPINVRDWCAAPCVADFNADGKLDMISGSYTWLPHKKKTPAFLRYYENIGTRSEPDFAEREFPFTGTLRTFRLPVPRATDWNHDGVLDLIVSSGANIYLFRNAGTRTEPAFEIHGKYLPARWGSARLPGRQFLDFNRDGFADLVSGYVVHLNSGMGSPYRFDKTINILPPGVHIDHPVEMGDGHFWPYLSDFDRDGRIDVLFGDWHGQVWFHRNMSTESEKRFDVAGLRLSMDNQQPIKVGPMNSNVNTDFVALQGARTVFTVADYDGDALNDLVVGDTYGKIRFYRNLGPDQAPRFSQPQLVGDMKFRLLVDAVDWNNDGRMDVIAGTASHKVAVFLNTESNGQVAFSDPIELKLPQIKETRVLMVDLNRDGDQDLFVMSTQGSILVERSFLEHGYARGRVLRLEDRQSNE